MHLKKVNLHPDKYPTREHYPFNLDIFSVTTSLSFNAPVTFFVGENGSGKSTLLDAITRRCGIMMWQGIQRPRFKASPYEKDLYQTIDVEWQDKRVPGSFFGSHIFQNFAQLWDEWLTMDPGLIEYLGGKSLMSQSHGQSLMAYFTSRFKLKGIYFLLDLIDKIVGNSHRNNTLHVNNLYLYFLPKERFHLFSFTLS